MFQIGVIIPVYNGAPYLEMAVSSVLRQKVAVEIIIVDNGSTDESAIIARQLAATHDEVMLIEQANGGVSSARNAGVRNSCGNVLCFLDADDQYAEGALSFFASELNSLIQERGERVMGRGRMQMASGTWRAVASRSSRHGRYFAPNVWAGRIFR